MVKKFVKPTPKAPKKPCEKCGDKGVVVDPIKSKPCDHVFMPCPECKK